jgi:hypothetical protein
MDAATGRDMRRRMWPVYAKAIFDAVRQHLSEHEAATIRGGRLAKPYMDNINWTKGIDQKAPLALPGRAGRANETLTPGTPG